MLAEFVFATVTAAVVSLKITITISHAVHKHAPDCIGMDECTADPVAPVIRCPD